MDTSQEAQPWTLDDVNRLIAQATREDDLERRVDALESLGILADGRDPRSEGLPVDPDVRDAAFIAFYLYGG